MLSPSFENASAMLPVQHQKSCIDVPNNFQKPLCNGT